MRRVERSLGPRRARMVGDLRGRVLEVGIGTGATLPHYAPGVDLVGVDLSPAMLDRARLRAAETVIEPDLREMDAQELAFPGHSFDAVVFTLCLCTIPQPSRAIREAIRVARPGAPIRMLEHVRSHILPIALVQDLLNPVTVLTRHDHFNLRTRLEAERAGVEGITEERWFLGIFTLIQGRAPR